MLNKISKVLMICFIVLLSVIPSFKSAFAASSAPTYVSNVGGTSNPLTNTYDNNMTTYVDLNGNGGIDIGIPSNSTTFNSWIGSGGSGSAWWTEDYYDSNNVKLSGSEYSTSGTTVKSFSHPIPVNAVKVKITSTSTINNRNGYAPYVYELSFDINDTTPPANVTNLTYSNLTSNSVQLGWTPPSDIDGSSIKVYQNGSLIVSRAFSSTGYAVTSLSPNTQYVFKVTSVDTTGNESTGSSISVTTLSPPDTTPPSEINSLITSYPSDTSAKVDFTEPTDSDFNHTNVYDSNGTKLGEVAKRVRFYTFTGLVSKQSYTYTFKTVDNTGNVSTGVSVTVMPPDTTPAQNVSNLSATVLGDNSIKLAWQNPSDSDFVQVQIFRGLDLVYSTQVTDTNYIDVGLSPNTTYTYVLKSVDSSNNVSSGVTVTARTTGVPDKVSGITNTFGNGYADFSWTAPSSSPSVDHYNVFVNGSLKASPTTNFFHLTNLVGGFSYNIQISAVNSSGEGLKSDVYKLDMPLILNPPTSITVSPQDGQLSLTWASVKGANGYNVFVNGVKNNSSLISGSAYTIKSLTNETKYSIQVSAVNDSMESELSAVVYGTPSVKSVPGISLLYKLVDISDGATHWFSSLWLIVAFGVSIPLAFIVARRVKELFNH